MHNLPEWVVNDLMASSIDTETALKYGIYAPNDAKSYIIPYNNPNNWGKPKTIIDGSKYYRRKLINGKYNQPKNSGIRCYVLPEVHNFYINNPTTPLLITEGEKKVIASLIANIPVIGIGGITMWRDRNGSNIINKDLMIYLKNKRTVYMVYDSDGLNKSNFERNSKVFARALKKIGCKLFVIHCPKLTKGKNGMDDILKNLSRKQLIEYMEWSKQVIDTRDGMEGTYGQVFYTALEKNNLTANEYLFLQMIWMFNKDNKTCNATKIYIANMLNVSEYTIHKYIKKFEEDEILNRQRQGMNKSLLSLTSKGKKIFE